MRTTTRKKNFSTKKARVNKQQKKNLQIDNYSNKNNNNKCNTYIQNTPTKIERTQVDTYILTYPNVFIIKRRV